MTSESAIIATGLLVLLLAACKPAADQAPAATAAVDAPPATPATEAAPAEEAAKPEIPTLSVDTVDGGHFDLAEHRGKWVW